jgi:hypothetical protein
MNEQLNRTNKNMNITYYMDITLTKSKRKNKKYVVSFNHNNRHYNVNFGGIKENGEPYEDYLTHKDKDRRDRYIKRHKAESRRWIHKKENLIYPSYWSRWLLWEKTNIRDAIKYIENAIKVNIIYNV